MMASEKRLIDANALKNQHTYLWDEALGTCECVLVEDIENAPTIDAVEVVRCKDCKYLEYGYQCYCPLGMKLNNDGDAYVLLNPDDDFCSYGERK